MKQSQLRDNLKLLMKRLPKLTESELARRTDVPQPTLHRILSGATPDPRISTLRPLAHYFGVSVGQLIGDEPIVTASAANAPAQTRRRFQQLPVLKWEQVADYARIVPGLNPSNWTDWIITHESVSPSAYALIVDNRSMPSPFQYRAILIVDPERKLRDSDYMVVHQIKSKSASLKRVLFDGGEIWLSHLREGFKAVPFDKDIQACGVVVQVQLPLHE